MSWVRCYTAATETEAHMVRGFLEGRGVPCVLRSMGSSMYPVPAFGAEVLVPPDWQRVAEQYLRPRRRPTRRVVALASRRMRA